MSARMRLLVTAVLVGLVLAPVTQAREWRGHGRDYGHHHGSGDAGAAIIGGLIGLGLGAAIASGGYAAPPAYYGPPPVYYGPPSAYYPSAPPPVYYGY